MWNVVGHKINKIYFEKVVKNDHLDHAYLFSGTEMIGKKTFAQELIKLLNNRPFENNPYYRLFANSIEDARALKAFLSIKPYYGPYKVAVIDDAEKLTIEAANAMLKILEEPSSSSIIILVSAWPKLLPLTILSRCQEIKFKPLSGTELNSFIPAKLKTDEKIELAGMALGRPGWVFRNKDRLGAIKNSIAEFNKILGQGIFEKIQYATGLHESENFQELISNLIYWHNSQAKNPKLLKGLLRLSKIISQPQYNRRLALENFLLSI